LRDAVSERDPHNTIVVPVPVGPAAALAVGGVVAVVIGWTQANPLLLLVDLVVMVGAIVYLGRGWAARHVRPAFDEARACGQPRPYVKYRMPWSRSS
jgi:uncharacterized membrane protein